MIIKGRHGFNGKCLKMLKKFQAIKIDTNQDREGKIEIEVKLGSIRFLKRT